MDMNISAENLRRIVCHLTDSIGIRLAGSRQEKEAADYLKNEFLNYTSNVHIEEFPINELYVERQKLEIQINGQWREFPCSLFSSAPSTHGETIEAPLEYLDTFTGYQRKDLSYLRGKAVVHLGCHFFQEDDYRRLMEARPAFILFVDTRYPGDKPLADGLFPQFVKKFGSLPSMNVAYQDAWTWCTSKAPLARLNVVGGMRKSQTSVVVAELPGTDPEAGIIYTGGHHDTQAGTVGADDNAIGSASCVEFARVLSQTSHKRTFRFCSFGAEEQLSQGSASYVRTHRDEITRNGVFMFNVDGCASAMGWGALVINAMPKACDKLRGILNGRGIYYTESHRLEPFTDQFPFAACGVPGLWLTRENCTSGIFYHHREINTPAVLDFQIGADYLTASAEFLKFLSDQEDLGDYAGFPKELAAGVSELFQNIFGGF